HFFASLSKILCSRMLAVYNERMNAITVQEIQRDFVAFLQRLEVGETLLLVRDGRPVAEVRPLAPATTQPRPFGLCSGPFSVPADFDHPLPDEILKEFEGA
ncbi:MAG: type II toxin-antitoxin system Phd/YefM family antitoxin, partial [Gemmataceae bacterium]